MTTKRDDRSMPHDSFMENGQIRRSSTDIYQCYSCFFFLFIQHCCTGSDGFQCYVCYFQTCFFDASQNVIGSSDLPGDDMKISLQPDARHPYRFSRSEEHTSELQSRGHL